jgi:hypothetical protein
LIEVIFYYVSILLTIIYLLTSYIFGVNKPSDANDELSVGYSEGIANEYVHYLEYNKILVSE